MSIFFTEVSTNNNPESLLFQFELKELPEMIEFPSKTKLNKIEYPGGASTTQIMGTFRGEVDINGQFYGTYKEGGKTITAKERSDFILSLQGRPLRVFFPVPGQGPVRGEEKMPDAKKMKEDSWPGGFKGIYVIEDYVQKIRNYSHVEFTLKLVPHDRQEKIKPTETTKVQVHPTPSIIQAHTKVIAKHVKPGAPKSHHDAVGAAAKGQAVATQMAPQGFYNGFVDKLGTVNKKLGLN